MAGRSRSGAGGAQPSRACGAHDLPAVRRNRRQSRLWATDKGRTLGSHPTDHRPPSLPRRALLGALAALPGLAFAGRGAVPAAAAAAAVATRTPIAFRVLREGAQIGTHRVAFRDAGGGVLRARSEVQVLVRLLGVTVYRYSHVTEEAWRGGRLLHLTSRLDRNGTLLEAEARAEGGALVLTGRDGTVRLPAETAPLTWWRAETFPDAPLFDPREGIPVRPRLERVPPLAPGGAVRWRLIGGEGAEIEYDAAGTWIAFATRGEDGSAVRYERQAPA